METLETVLSFTSEQLHLTSADLPSGDIGKLVDAHEEGAMVIARSNRGLIHVSALEASPTIQPDGQVRYLFRLVVSGNVSE